MSSNLKVLNVAPILLAVSLLVSACSPTDKPVERAKTLNFLFDEYRIADECEKLGALQLLGLEDSQKQIEQWHQRLDPGQCPNSCKQLAELAQRDLLEMKEGQWRFTNERKKLRRNILESIGVSEPEFLQLLKGR